MGLKEFIDWNKKIMNDPEPAIAWKYERDDEGKSRGKIFFFGSWITWDENPKINSDTNKELKKINKEGRKEIDFDCGDENVG